MALEEAAAYLGNDLILPIGGKKYRVSEYDAEVGLRVEVVLNAGAGRVSDRARQVLDDEAEKDLYRDVLGDAYDQLFPNVSWSMLKLAAITAMYHFNVSDEVGEEVWNQGVGAGKATSRSSRPATRRTTAAASSTRSRASGSGTRSRRSS